ncbi:MAG: hypothetical protein GVY22_02235 [Gammaproteobacteria bacterium]|jgi:hypothetical protein|nr:hypothetical protein [Gammaproteobacteria bacterium]
MDFFHVTPWTRNEYGLVVPSAGNLVISGFTTWSSGTAITDDDIRYDDHDGQDYEALVDISGGDNTIRPSEAVLSTDEEIAARWALVDIANGNRLFDEAQNIRATGSSPLQFTISTTSAADSLAITSIASTVTDISVVITKDGLADIHLSAAPDGARCVRWQHASRTAATYAVTLTGSGTVGAGEIVAGVSRSLGPAEAPISHDRADYSERAWDENYGTYRYTERGYSRIIRGTIHVPDRLGDWADRQVSLQRAAPTIWDLNDTQGAAWPGTSEPGRIVYGVPTQVQRSDHAIEHIDTLSLEITGLVED